MEMKTIYKVLYPLGYEEHEVEDDFPTSIPFVEVGPIQNLENPQSQFFNFQKNIWEEVVTQNFSEKLELIETLAHAVQTENEELKEMQRQLTQLNARLMLNDVALTNENIELKSKADVLAQINSKTMLASLQNSKDIADIKSQLEVTEGGN